ncbi:molybdenum cofactor carrier [Legionella israelensis]|uniref:putative molybdenum carrier protein n=1 Tax=Legionella israelensis TaxID=454 RepID=UPI0011812FB9|nr:putative molybdenum carrier protein [Legionella israelensis]QDP73273.1 molybdenum cofactor carrier [Legionella israelensis]
MNLPIDEIISGGQTGVDRAALDFAISHSIPHGGACPKGRFAEDGKLSEKYQMYEVGTDESQLSVNYSLRTVENIKQSDGTLILVPVYPIPEGVSDGTKMTIKKTKELKKPVFVYQFGHSSVEDIRDWLKQNKIKILNVAGPRESNFPGVYHKSYALLEALFSLNRSL